MLASLRKYFISGLLVWLPILVTIYVIRFLVGFFDSFRLDAWLGVDIPGLGFVIACAVITLTGMLVANWLGKKLVLLSDKIISKIPLVRTIYLGMKQILETMFNSKGKAFRKVLLVEYPRKGLWSIAFQTGEGSADINPSIAGGEEVVTLFIPTTPNPTSGFLMMAPKKDVIELNMSVDQALKFVISLGVMQPKL
jgi:uncharacterized membrane protein